MAEHVVNQMNQGKEPKLDSIYLPDKETMDRQEAHLKSTQTRERSSSRKRSQSYLGVQKPIVDKHTQSVADASISTIHRFLKIHHIFVKALAGGAKAVEAEAATIKAE